MSKKINMSKKKAVGLLVLLVAILAGVTYAWWTASSSAKLDVVMGELALHAEFDATGSTELFEPGLESDFSGRVVNQGTLPIILKVTNKSLISFKYLNDAKAPNPDFGKKYEDDLEIAIGLSFGPESGSFSDVEGAYWFQKAGDASQKFLLLDEGTTVPITTNAAFSESMTNRYQGALVEIKASFDGTQVVEGAMKQELGVDFSELEGLDDTRSTSGRANQRLLTLLKR